MSSERTFTIESSETNVTGGRFSGKSPYVVALKAARKLFRESSSAATKKQIRFQLRETTRGSPHAVYTYIGEKTLLPEPKVVVRGDTEITITHTYNVKACEA
jgi:Non-histone chromosomal protein MC1